MSGGAIGVWGLRVAVAIGVGVGVSLGCFRIITGLAAPLLHRGRDTCRRHRANRAIAPKLIVPLAYDSGGVTTSTVTVPLVLRRSVWASPRLFPGAAPLLDGFGLVAFASLFPIISVLAYGQLAVLRARASSPSLVGDSEAQFRKNLMHFKLIVAFVEDSKTDAIMGAAREAGATGCTVISNARGEGLKESKTFFGLDAFDTQRDVVLPLGGSSI